MDLVWIISPCRIYVKFVLERPVGVGIEFPMWILALVETSDKTKS